MNANPEQQAATPLPDETYYRRGEGARRWGSLLLVVGLIWLVFEVMTRGSFLGIGLGFVERSATLPEARYRAERVVVSGLHDRIELVRGSGAEVVLEVTRRGYGWNGASAEHALDGLVPVVTEQDGVLAVEVSRPTTVGAFLGRRPMADLRLRIPEGVAVEAHLTSGDIVVRNVQSDLQLHNISGMISTQGTIGSLTVHNTSGKTEVRDHRGPFAAENMSGTVEAEGRLEAPQVRTVSGSIRLDGANGAVDVRSISGSVELKDARNAQLTLDTTSGTIEAIVALAPAMEHSITTISGGVQLHLLPADDLRLVATTISGDISSNLRFDERNEERRQLSGTIGRGSTQLTVATTSGSIHIDGP
ncbi:MAG: hypothetical protein EI684_17880 [Candidatus Viridilinea halotolerans]|uniref:DUF4097 domain-containing protein n=1 Tax=Candidatus Viridilinea halotolerans TaxID=2491704 RepID=A0A426TTX3_9CHLR|nr:MAG: hypothetical protein EI684_17880 [Candidatus Viridilinea halotolerans]